MSKEIVDAIISGENLEAEKQFSTAISGKVGDALEIKRRELAKVFVNTEPQETTTDETD
ncbi:MAG: hypothetical protein QGH83_02580 [Candidatus Pacebacteria bacterium]|jgi:hypothetical protein|nr:hypothetical protein [Candidatus Paceibacterota bacterium]|tara:strand:+ start:290 stop:466 length:177 start_codon:yes stop_codon:yes gene_type:complete